MRELTPSSLELGCVTEELLQDFYAPLPCMDTHDWISVITFNNLFWGTKAISTAFSDAVWDGCTDCDFTG